MAKSNYGSVHTLIAVDNPMLRKGLHDALRHDGFGNAVEAPTVDHLHKALSESTFDLIVMASEMGGTFIASQVAEIRNGRTGGHPFPVIMVLLPVAQQDYVKTVIDGGPDDMLLMPVAPGRLLSRAAVFARQRKPFVVTQDYTGPDRRKKQRPGPGNQTIPLIDVPNPLLARVKDVPAEILQRDIEAASTRLAMQKLERYAVQLRWLNDQIGAMASREQVDPAKLQSYVIRLKQVAEDVPQRLKGGVNLRISGLLTELVEGADAFLGGEAQTDAQWLERLDGTIAALAEEILRRLPQGTVAGASA